MRLETQTLQYLLSVGAEFEKVEHGARGPIVSRAAAVLNYSEKWVYARLKELGFMKGRKQRCDRGISKITRDECVVISNMMTQSNRDNGKQLMSLKEAVRIANANGLIASQASVSTIAREMKRHKVSPELIKQATPHRQVRSLHPNHVWQFDVSICVLYYLRNNEGLQVMPHDEFYKNKPENVERIKNDRVLRYLITDHFTGAFYVEYFNAPGENSDTLIDFLLNAFGKREDSPLHGVPFILVWDAGTANQSHLVKGMLERLNVNHLTHAVGSPRAKGQVERTHNLVECEFEGRLSMCRVDSIEQLNAQAQRWAHMYNGTVCHRRHGHSRYGLWQTIKAEQLRLRPARDFCLALLEKIQPAKRKVKGDLTIDFAIKGIGSNAYSVESIPDVCISDTVQVTYNPYQVPDITVIHENLQGEIIHYNVSPIERDEAGFDVNAPVYGESFKSIRDTPVDTVRKAMNREAYGVETDLEVKQARKARTPAFEGRIDPFADVHQARIPEFIPRKGQRLTAITPIRQSDVKTSYVKAVPMIRDSIGLLAGSDEAKRLIRIFKQRYPEGIPEESIFDFTQEMDALLGTTVTMRRVKNGE